MDSIDFKEIYIETLIEEIKKDVSKKVNLNSKWCLNCSKESKVDLEMKMLLRSLIGEEDRATDFINSLVWLKMDNVVKNRLRCLGELYYTAFYFDNVRLLKKIMESDFQIGNTPENLKLCLLDSDITTFFEEDEYIEFLKRTIGYFDSFYNSIKNENYVNRRKYINKFINILRKREDFYCSDFSDAFTKKKLDVYEESTYLKVSVRQFENVIEKKECEWGEETFTSGMGPFAFDFLWFDEKSNLVTKKENIKRINRLLRETDFSHLIYYVDQDTVFDLFTDSELAGMSAQACKYFKLAEKQGTLEDVIKIFRIKKNITNYTVTCWKDFLKMFDVETVAFLSDETLDWLQANRIEYFEGEITPLHEKLIKRKVKKDASNNRKLLENKIVI